MKILGISAYYHDSAAAIIVDGKIIAAAQEERFTRKKHDSSFPKNAIQFCLNYAGLTIDELDAVAFYDKPFLKFERLLETYYTFSPKGLRSFLQAIPIWLKEKIFLKKQLKDGLKTVETYDVKQLKLLFPEHHLSHAASAFYPSPYKKAAILTIDGVGEWATASISYGKDNTITVLKEMHFPHSLGLLYSAFTYFLGFKVNYGEYKLMGLAPYGNPKSEETIRFIHLIKTQLIDLKQDGSLWLNPQYFTYATGLRMVNAKKWAQLFGFSRRNVNTAFEQKHSNLAFAIQAVTEEAVLKMAHEAKRLTKADYLCMAGGVALNCVANGKLIKANIFKEIFIQPAAGDAGGALGAALAAQHIYFQKERKIISPDAMQGTYLGPKYSDLEIRLMSKQQKAQFKYFKNFNDLSEKVAQLITDGKVIGWMQGRMEFGPRALGNRSILGDARNTEMQKILNLKIKFRESFRPFAPSVLATDYQDFFELNSTSPYMLIVAPIAKHRRKTLSKNYDSLALKDKLEYLQSDLPAITHVDFSARVQTVHQAINPRYAQLLSAIKALTGEGIVVNTSFNIKDEPIVCTPEDAYRCFMQTDMDYLVINNFLFQKRKSI